MIRGDFREILSAEMIAVTGGLLAGGLLAFFTHKLELIPGIFILLPGFLSMMGNINGSLSARLSAALILGAMKPEITGQRILKGNVLASFALSVSTSAILGLGAFMWSAVVFGIFAYKIILVAVAAGVLSNAIQIVLTTYAVMLLFRHDHDPNNIMGPYVTTTGDVVSVASLLTVMAFV